MSPSQNRHTRSGYTLIEMLIASVLVSTLLAGAWNMMSLYNGLLASGQQRTEEIQLARSVLRLVENDLSQLQGSFGNGNDISPGFEFGSNENPLTEFMETEFSPDETERTPPAAVMLTGTESAIRITFYSQSDGSRSTSDIAIDELNRLGGGSLSEFSKQSARGGEFERNDQRVTVREYRTVVYQWRGPAESINDDQSAFLERDEPAANSTADPEFALERIETNAIELNRLEQARSTLEQNMRSGSVRISANDVQALLNPDNLETDARSPETDANPADETDLLNIPEVTHCKFQYFDGTNWNPAWPPQASKQQSSTSIRTQSDTLPVAVKMEFTLRMNVKDSARASQQTADMEDSLQSEANSSFSTARPRGKRYEKVFLLQSDAGVRS